ncbi:Uma2 family endonuclease [Streptosporangium becharense]|uniref:Uma2 family endonuclease n=1 Tax=Streptosporangium becharense TaxID=1816182 RepID=A0A7W9IDL0_9ACTN|nr:Uma2 family endonuclease [Streptosporangium becharense]MBB2912213.1 Uma2 family endonuclease [Streptosporangium becharense]MBB5818760.1 Uma2 family endonuclease [Streptosporangium becharense]
MAMLMQTSEAPVKARKPHKKAAPKTSVWETPGELSVEEWFELNSRDDGGRYELIDGSLIVSPAPPFRHQRIGDRLQTYLETMAPEEMIPVTATGLLLDHKPGVIPDLMVVELAPFEDGAEVALPEWVHLVVEIVSKSTTATDRTVKHAKYAEAGIPHFWRVEMRPFRGQGSDELPVIFTYSLDEAGEYQLIHRVAAGTTVDLTEPFKLTLDPAALSQIR